MRADLAPSGVVIGPVADHDLALAVIAETARLQAPRAHRARRPQQQARAAISTVAIRRDRDAERLDEILLGRTILRRRQDARVRQHRLARRQEGRGLRRHVLEFVGDDVDVGGETIERLRVGIVGAGHAMHDVEGGRFRVRREHVAIESEPRGREREHAAELAAAENADDGAGLEQFEFSPSDAWRRLRSGVRANRPAAAQARRRRAPARRRPAARR